MSIQNKPERIHMTAAEDASAIASALAEISDGNTHAVTAIYERMGRQSRRERTSFRRPYLR